MLIGALALAAALAVSGVLFARRAKLLVDLVRMGKPAERFDDVPGRVRNEAEIVLGQRKLLQRLVPGLIHAAIFWGFLVLFPTILIAMIGAVDREATLPWLGHQGWFALLVDVFAVLVLAGVIGAAIIRKVQRPARFQGSHLGEADLILALIAGIVTTLLLWHAARIALGLNEWPQAGRRCPTRCRPVRRQTSHRGARASLRLGPRADHPQLPRLPPPLKAPAHRHRRGERLLHADPCAGPPRAAAFDGPEDEMRFGAGTVPDLTWKQTLDTFSCTECGRCQDVCPAWTTGKELSPKLLIMALRDQVFEDGPPLVRGAEGFEPSPLVPGAVTDNVVWDCVTCGACVRECPVSIEHVDHIVDLRRHLVMVESRFPPEAEQMLPTSCAPRTRGASPIDRALRLGRAPRCARVLAPG